MQGQDNRTGHAIPSPDLFEDWEWRGYVSAWVPPGQRRHDAPVSVFLECHNGQWGLEFWPLDHRKIVIVGTPEELIAVYVTYKLTGDTPTGDSLWPHQYGELGD